MMVNRWIENSGSVQKPKGIHKGDLVDVQYRDGLILIGVTAFTSRSDSGFRVIREEGGTNLTRGRRMANSWAQYGGNEAAEIVRWRFYIPELKTRKEAREFCKTHPEYHVVDNGVDSNPRWGVSNIVEISEI